MSITVDIFGFYGVGKTRVVNAIRLGNGDITFTDDDNNTERVVHKSVGKYNTKSFVINKGLISKKNVYRTMYRNFVQLCKCLYEKLKSEKNPPYINEDIDEILKDYWRTRDDTTWNLIIKFWGYGLDDEMHVKLDNILNSIINLSNTHLDNNYMYGEGVGRGRFYPLYFYNLKDYATKHFNGKEKSISGEGDSSTYEMTQEYFLNAYVETVWPHFDRLNFKLKTPRAWFERDIIVNLFDRGGAPSHLDFSPSEVYGAKIFIFVISALSNKEVSETLSYYYEPEEKQGDFDPEQVIVFISKIEMATALQIEKCKAAVTKYFTDDATKTSDKTFKSLQNYYVVTAPELNPSKYPVLDIPRVGWLNKLDPHKLYQNVAHHLLNCLGKTLNPAAYNKTSPPVNEIMESQHPSGKGGRRRTIKKRKNRRSKKTRNRK
jgi:hypothetical protein